MSEFLKTPVLLVIFNRPDTTRLVLDAIRKVKPQKLYVAGDGPRKNVATDIERCNTTRQLIANVDWDCEVKTYFRDENVGCGIGPSSAYDWFFENEEEGIILEDDCLPDETFFEYCEQLLEKYRYDTRIMHISGSNFLHKWQNDQEYSYYYSSYLNEWGWASWRRAWKFFDYSVATYPEIKKKNYLNGYYTSVFEKLYRLGKIASTYGNKKADWWDYQWDYTLHIQSGLAIVPNVNLIENIGFGEDATHTISKRLANEKQAMVFPLKHPPFMIRDRKSDARYFRSLMYKLIYRKFFGMLGINGYDVRG